MEHRRACRPCRVRKVKCSKEFPKCLNCRNCGEPCVYPSTVLKPGPKRGSVHKRRRYYPPDMPWEESELRPSTAASIIRSDSPSSENLLPLSAASPPQPAASPEDNLAYSEHLQVVADLCQPTHAEPSSQGPGPPPTSGSGTEDVLSQACRELEVSQDRMVQMISTFFHTFTTFRLFRKPSFLRQLSEISSAVQVKALLAAVFAFACKGESITPPISGNAQLSAGEYADLAIKYVDEAMDQCGDDTPPLCLLQSLILTTHWMIISGVRGKAWRRVGLCVRLLFEMELHSIDAVTEFDMYAADPEKWCQAEEGRRAYWAVWEMDQFSSHLKRLPITSDWARDRVHLPAEDQRWLAARPQKSCPLAPDWMDRCKNLHAAGSRSALAWYIVIASLNAVAHDMAYSRHNGPWAAREHVRQQAHRWPAFINALHLGLILLPPEFQFHGQYLDFGTQTMGLPPDPAISHLHSTIYNIALMPETSKIMTLRPFVFDAYMRKLLRKAQGSESGSLQSIGLAEDQAQKVEQCFNAADRVLNLIVNSHASHYRYVNPYVTQVSWLGATVRLLQQALVDDQAQKRLIRSKFEIFKATNEKFMHHWNMSSTPKRNLETLALRLERFGAASRLLMSSDRMSTARMNNPPFSPQTATNTDRHHTGRSRKTLSRHAQNRMELAPGPDASAESTRPHGVGRHANQSTPAGVRCGPWPVASVPPSEISSSNTMRSPLSAERLDDNPTFPVPYQPAQEMLNPNANPTLFEQNISAGLWPGAYDQISQPASMNSEPLDWLSIFTDNEMNEGLTDCFEMFSAPYPL